MPYKNIHWIKLQVRLLNDHRFFAMTERSQLFYIKILLLCGQNNNKVPKNYQKMRALLRCACSEAELQESMEEIRSNFPKVMETGDFYFIRGFKALHNWVSPGSSPGVEKAPVDKRREDKIRREQITEVVEFYVKLKRIDREMLNHSDWVRYQVAATALLKKTKGDVPLAIEAINWLDKKGYNEWTLETVWKKYQYFTSGGVQDEEVKDLLKDVREYEKTGNS